MRSLLCFSALALCSATDAVTEEQSSLMQLKIPRAAKAGAHHVQLLGLDIETQEGRVALLDKVRTLAKKVADGKIDDATVELLDGAVGMAADVLREQALPAVQSQHDAAVRELNVMADNVHACESDPQEGQAAVDALGRSTQGLRGDHQTCRGEEHVVHEEQTRVCDDWTTFLTDLAEPPCPLPDRAEREDVVAQLERLEHYAETYTAPATEKMDHCHTMTEELEAKRLVCNGKQADFESSYCAHQQSCVVLSECHDREKAAFEQFTVVVAEGVDARKLEFRTITQIQCFLDLIVQAAHSGAPVGDDDLNRCGEDVNTDHLNIVPPAINPITPCDADMMSRGTCSPAFFSTEYAAMPQHETVEGLCVACPMAPPDRSNDRVMESPILATAAPPVPVVGTAAPSSTVTMEVGTVEMMDTHNCAPSCENDGVVHHTFSNTFSQRPVVVAMMTTTGPHPARMRVFDVTTTGFSAIVAEPANEDGPHLGFTASYVAMLPGVHTLQGLQVEAGRITTSGTIERPTNIVGSSTTINFQSEFGSPPAFLSAIQTRNNNPAGQNLASWSPFLGVATLEVTNEHGDVILEKHEVGGDVTETEEIGWIAMEPGTGCVGEVCLAAGTVRMDSDGRSGWTGYWNAQPTAQAQEFPYSTDNFDLNSAEPLLVGCLVTRNGNNGGWPRLESTSSTGFKMVVDECRGNDQERDHIPENLSFVALSAAADLAE
jgi:hypothetical protein